MTTNTAYRFTSEMIEGIRAYDRPAILAAQARVTIAKVRNADKLNNALASCEVALMAAGWNGLAHYLAVDTTPKAPKVTVTPKAPVKRVNTSDMLGSDRYYVTGFNGEGHRIHRRMSAPKGVNVVALAQDRYQGYTITAITAR